MRIVVIIKKNPFVHMSAASNRILSLCKDLCLTNEVKFLIFGGSYSHVETDQFSFKGRKSGIDYEYINPFSNKTRIEKIINEYLFLEIRTSKNAKKILEMIYSSESQTIIWFENDFHSYKIFNNLNKALNKFDFIRAKTRFFIEINEYLDAGLHNNSVKFFWQKKRIVNTINYFYDFILPNVDGIALMTKKLMGLFNERISKSQNLLHVPMTVDLKRFDIPEQVESNSIVFIGSMNNLKDGVDILIDAFSRISKDFPNYKLELFGFWGYDSLDHLAKIKNLNLQSRVIYSKPISPEDVIIKLKSSKILVLPRPNSYQAEAGFPTKLGEYLASSKPVIVSSVGEICDYLDDNISAFIINPGSVDSLEQKLRFVITHYEDVREVGMRGRKVAEENFSAEKQSLRLNHFFQILMK